ncbi:MAG: c-type cytochrome [Myxococcota bacterium]
MSLVLFLVACGGEPQKEAAGAAASAPAPSAPAAAPAAPAEVGPDGPADIAVVAVAEIPTDPAIVAEGEKVYGAKGCGGCHAFGSKLVGPDLVGLTQRRTTPWITKMIAEPDAMTKKDPVARDLFKTHMVQMPKQGVTPEEMPKLLAYIKSKGG